MCSNCITIPFVVIVMQLDYTMPGFNRLEDSLRNVLKIALHNNLRQNLGY